MTIAYVFDTFPSPSETFLAREIDALRWEGLNIEVWAIRAGDGARSIDPPQGAQRMLRLAGRASPAMRSQFFQKWGVLWSRQLRNVDHIHAAWASHPACLSWGAARACGLPWSFSGHSRDIWVDGLMLPQKLRAARFASACTRRGADHLRALAPDAASRVLDAPHGLPLNDYAFAPSRHWGRMRVLSVGRLVPKKGFDVLLEAMSLLPPESRLTILGDGPLRAKLEQRRDALGLQERVEFRGWQLPSEVIAAMREADVFALPCRVARDGDRDGLPNVLLEAAALGLPIVAARAGAVEEFVDATTGWLCPPDDANALAQAIRTALSEPEQADKRRHRARRRVEQDFDVEKNVRILARAFEK